MSSREKKQDKRTIREQARRIVAIESREQPKTGRKVTPRGLARRLLGIRNVTEEVFRAGKLPLPRMIDNMTFYAEKATKLELELGEELAQRTREVLTDEEISPKQRQRQLDQLERIAQLLEKIGDNLMKSQICARDAAPYLHQRLQHTTLNVTGGHVRDLPPSASPEEFRERYRQLRARPYSVPLAVNNQTGEEVEAELIEPDDD